MNLQRRGMSIPTIQVNKPGNQKEVQNFIASQIYMKGFVKGVSVGNNPDIQLVLGGSARQLYGFNLFIQQSTIAEDDYFSLKLNNETIIDSALWRAFNPVYNYNRKIQFFELPRPLNGNDNLTMSYTAVSAKNIYPVFYLSTTNEYSL